MSFLSLDDMDLYYEVYGNGEPLFLIPGLCGTCDSFSLIIRKLAKNFKVITLDNRGAGRSIPTNANFTIATMADDLAELVNHLGFKRINLLGHSMGGFIAQEYTARNSGSVKNLILSNTSQKSSYRNRDLFDCLANIRNEEALLECWHRIFSQWIFTESFINSKSTEYEASISYSLNYPYAQKAQWFAAQVFCCREFDFSKKNLKLDNRSLIICGEEDILILPEESKHLKSSFRNSEICLMKRSGHLPMIENKEEYSSIIMEFLSGE